MRLLSAGEGQIVPFLGPPLSDWTGIIRHSPREDPVGTQWETCGKNRQQGLGTKGFPQKKVLSLVLCVAMLLSVMVMGTGAAFTDEDDFSPQYAEAAEVLTNLKVMQGYDDGSFLPQRNITRAQVATMIYRAATGDVNDTKTDIYKDYDKFDDVQSTDWFAGYVGYCANGELIKGFTPTTFGPNKNVTGYQVLAMILRAVGYDANDEFTGSGWEIRTATTAESLGMLKNVQEATLGQPATRELVAELIFRAMLVPTVTYMPAVGYVPVKEADKTTLSLGEREFELTGPTDQTDDWGRPAYRWNYEVSGKSAYTDVAIAPVATHNVATSQCDIATDLGENGKVTVDIYTNGTGNKTTSTISASNTKAMLGGQGTQIEVYDYTNAAGKQVNSLVIVDTYLAQVTDVISIRTDNAGHLSRNALIELDVYSNGYQKAPQTVYLTDDEDYTYTEGQMVLVNAVDSTNGQIAYTAKNVLGIGNRNIADTLDILQAAESIVGSQSKIFWNDQRHEINDTTYNDAARFYLDDAGNDQDANHTWYFDQFGNLIGAMDVISSNYAVLKDIQWITVPGEDGYAQATLVDFSGNQTKATIDTIDGNTGTDFTTWANKDYTPLYNDRDGSIGFLTNGNYLRISDELSRNAALNGYALYRVDTNLDDTVSLQGYDFIEYATSVTITTNASALLDIAGMRVISVNDNTQYMVRDASDNTYDVYTGTASIPTIKNANVFYCDVNNDTIADYVYVKTGTLAAMDGSHVIYVSDGSYSKSVNANTYVMENVILDGVENSTVTVKDESVAKNLAAGEGKTFVADFDNGIVDTVALATVNTKNVSAPETTSKIVYLGDDVKVNGNTMIGEYNTTSYRIDNAAACGEDVELTTSELDGYGVWVVYTTGTYNTVSHIYVGTALGETATMTATVTSNNVSEKNLFDVDNETWTYKNAGAQATLSVVLHDNATLKVDNSGTFSITAETNKPFTVVSEAGNVTYDYVVKITPAVVPDTVPLSKDYTLYVGSAIQDQPTLAYVDKADALAYAKTIDPANNGTENVTLTIGGTAASAGQKSLLDIYETMTIAQGSSFNGSSSENVDLNSGNVILIQITYENTKTCYVAYVVK